MASNTRGRVVANFDINEDGSISNIQIVRSLSNACDQEVIRILKAMPNWRPGKKDGKAVKATFSLPITFTLGDD